MVYRCTEARSGRALAAKVIDVRPLRLNQSFNQARLMREIEIMQGLAHPNIVRMERFVEIAQVRRPWRAREEGGLSS